MQIQAGQTFTSSTQIEINPLTIDTIAEKIFDFLIPNPLIDFKHLDEEQLQFSLVCKSWFEISQYKVNLAFSKFQAKCQNSEISPWLCLGGMGVIGFQNPIAVSSHLAANKSTVVDLFPADDPKNVIHWNISNCESVCFDMKGWLVIDVCANKMLFTNSELSGVGLGNSSCIGIARKYKKIEGTISEKMLISYPDHVGHFYKVKKDDKINLYVACFSMSDGRTYRHLLETNCSDEKIEFFRVYNSFVCVKKNIFGNYLEIINATNRKLERKKIYFDSTFKHSQFYLAIQKGSTILIYHSWDDSPSWIIQRKFKNYSIKNDYLLLEDSSKEIDSCEVIDIRENKTLITCVHKKVDRYVFATPFPMLAVILADGSGIGIYHFPPRTSSTVFKSKFDAFIPRANLQHLHFIKFYAQKIFAVSSIISADTSTHFYAYEIPFWNYQESILNECEQSTNLLHQLVFNVVRPYLFGT